MKSLNERINKIAKVENKLIEVIKGKLNSNEIEMFSVLLADYNREVFDYGYEYSKEFFNLSTL